MAPIWQVAREQLRWNSRLGKFLAKASALGFLPDYWPLFFEVETRIGTVLFERRDATYTNADGGELISYDYFTEKGNHQLTVIND